jgi:hypothetical protein
VKDRDRAVLLVFDQPLVAGETCVVTTQCSVDDQDVTLTEATYTITEAVPLPSAQSLGSVVLGDVRWRDVLPDTGCAMEPVRQCGAFLSLTLPEALAPWADAFVYQLNDYDERVEIGGRHVWLYDNGRTDARELTIEGWVPGTNLLLSSTSLTTPILCDSEPDEEDAGVVIDAGVTLDGSVTPPSDDADCSCSVPGQPRRNVTTPWLLAVTLLGLGARRFRSSRAASRARARRG